MIKISFNTYSTMISKKELVMKYLSLISTQCFYKIGKYIKKKTSLHVCTSLEFSVRQTVYIEGR